MGPAGNAREAGRRVFLHRGGGCPTMPLRVDQIIAADGSNSLWRKVRAPKGRVPDKFWAARADGKCRRKYTARKGKGEKVR